MKHKLFNPCVQDETQSISFTYSGSGQKSIDFTAQKNNSIFTGIKTVFIDNSNNDSTFELIATDTYQRIVCPAFKQGYFILLTNDVTFIGKSNAGHPVTVPLQFINYEIAVGVY